MINARAYYNEFDPYAAAWLRNLIAAGHIAPGDVDERSIEDVRPDDLRGYTQCHFFAGIGIWSLALRRAGWSDDREIWTGSCPCQPFSAAGKGAGFADERHLWPAFHWLIQQCRPAVVAGEQVASKDGLGWLDLVQADLEGTGYASRAVDLCAAGVGAPHIRQRLWWIGERMADAASSRSGTRLRGGEQTEHGRVQLANNSAVRGLADADGRNAGAERQQRGGEQRQQQENNRIGGLADNVGTRLEGGDARAMGRKCATIERGGGELAHQPATGPVNGHWRDADWLFCRDGKWRPVEPGTFPLAHGAPSRVGRLRAYGNAIVADAAQAFIEAYLDTRDDRFRLTDVSRLSPKEDVFS